MNFIKIFFEGTPQRVCRTRMISDRFFQCKVKKPNPKYCEFSLCSGDGFICNHQDRALFSREKAGAQGLADQGVTGS